MRFIGEPLEKLGVKVFRGQILSGVTASLIDQAELVGNEQKKSSEAAQGEWRRVLKGSTPVEVDSGGNQVSTNERHIHHLSHSI